VLEYRVLEYGVVEQQADRSRHHLAVPLEARGRDTGQLPKGTLPLDPGSSTTIDAVREATKPPLHTSARVARAARPATGNTARG
jgi:hypothetical protein